MIKKFSALFLLFAFMSVFSTPLSAGNSKETLSEFLKNTDEINAKYTYPSMKVAISETGNATLKAHTPIIIRCSETITTRTIVSGDTVNFSVVSDVKDNNGNILVKSGTPVSASIAFSKKSGMIGKSGELTVSDFHTTAVDGSYVALSGSVSARPDDNLATSIVLSVIVCPLFLLIKGDEARLEAGATKTAYTIADIRIDTLRN